MTGLDKILDEIKAKGRQKADTIKAGAQEEASDIIKKGELQIADDKEYFQKEMEKMRELEIQKGISGALSQKKKEILSSKQELINATIVDAKNYIAALEKKQYEEFWSKIAVKYAHLEDGQIILCEKDKSLGDEFLASINSALSSNSKGNLTLSDRVIKAAGGFVMVYGDVEENCTLDAVISNNQEVLQDKLNEILFG